MKKKEAIILNHNGGELANQLWNHISVFAYTLEKGYACKNYCFFEYAPFFSITPQNSIVNIIFYRSFRLLLRFLPFLLLKKIFRRVYRYYQFVIKKKYPNSIIYSRTTHKYLGTFLLPPTQPAPKSLSEIEGGSTPILFDGWLFRNPIGIRIYRKEILAEMRPLEDTERIVKEFMEPIRKKYKTVIGLHLRQGDYVNFKHGKFFVQQERVRKIIDEYIEHFSIDTSTSCFVICSNGPIEHARFKNLAIVKSEHAFVRDLFILAACDVILGSDSTFGSLAAYYGNIPHIIFKKEEMDWKYYQNKKEYFDNIYCLTLCNFPEAWNGFA